MGKKELSKINACWATGKDLAKLNNPVLSKGRDYNIIGVNLQKLIAQAQFCELNIEKLITDDINDFRYVDILERWERGQVVDPPTLYIDESDFFFSDGRHRTIAAYHIGEIVIPIAVHKNYKREDFRKIL